MPLHLVFIILLEVACKIFTHADAYYDRNFYLSIQDDLKELNASCSPYDTCMEPRKGDILSEFNCNCQVFCTQYDTCCVDSLYTTVRHPKIRQACRYVGNSRTKYMVDSCDDTNSVWEALCNEEWNGEDDAMKIVPLTSLHTLITYKNYFCFRCHENTNDFLYWNLMLESNDHEFDQSIDDSTVSLSYDSYYGVWYAPVGIGGSFIPVNLKLEIPDEIFPLTVDCVPDLISHCSEAWSDKDVSDKCEAYMGIIYISRDDSTFKYRNVHCALCNYEDLGNMACQLQIFASFGVKKPFSFTHLLDINPSDGDKVGKVEKCERNFLWDPYAKKCRKLTCALPGYVVKNGQCTPP